MEFLGAMLFILLVGSPFIAFGAAAWVYFAFRKMPDPSKGRPLLPFIGGVATFAAGFWVLGTILGVTGACALSQQAQCGLVGIFFVGPLACALGVLLYLLSWVKRGKAL
jgi:hypothetical protein